MTVEPNQQQQQNDRIIYFKVTKQYKMYEYFEKILLHEFITKKKSD